MILEREPPISQSITNETNKQEKIILQQHIKRNQELHEVLKAYLIKFEDSASSIGK
jgi:hypothetical protein